MQTEVNRIYHLLDSVFSGDPWHGSSVLHILSGIIAPQASQPILPHSHTIWQLVLHMIAWRTFAWQKLNGNAGFDILSPEEDWPVVSQTDEQSWQQTLLDLRKSQQSLLGIVKGLDNASLDKIVPGRSYTCYVLLHGIIQHDLYHSGQIALLKKQFA